MALFFISLSSFTWIRVSTGAGPSNVSSELPCRDDEYAIPPAPSFSGSPHWTTESDQANANLGASVSWAGDVDGDGYSDVIVGAWAFANGETQEGRAYLYKGSSSGVDPAPAWVTESNQAYARFGISVASAGDVDGDGYSDVIVGSSGYSNGEGSEGRVFLYEGSSSGLSGSPSWTTESDQSTSWMGTAVATAGDVDGDGYSDVLVGVYRYTNGESDEGRAFLFQGSSSGLLSTPLWSAESNHADAWFGNSLATAGDVNGDGYADVLVGAHQYDNGGGSEGRAYLYLGSSSGPGIAADWSVIGDQASATFGEALASAGDVNGDGYGDVIVGAFGYDNGEADEGRAYLYFGSSSGLSGTAAWIGEGNQGSAWFGTSVSAAGDANSDGYADVFIGARGYDNGEPFEGGSFLFLGSSSGLGTTAIWSAEGDQASSGFGVAVSTAGDVDGDGFSDMLIGALTYANGEADEGRAFVYLGASSLPASTAAWTAEGDQDIAIFAEAVASAGDINGDGYSDVLVGGRLYDNGESSEGQARLYLGSASGLELSATWMDEGNKDSAFYGVLVASAGDVNGDGLGDFVVGASNYNNGESGEGRAYLYLGSNSSLDGAPDWMVESNQALSRLGWSAGTAGDVNGDGFNDVLVGAYAYSNGESSEGRAYLYLGSVSGLAPLPAWTAESDQAISSFGYSVAAAGDVNGDGYSDVLIGAPDFTNGQLDEGACFVYLGSVSGLETTFAWNVESNVLDVQNDMSFGASVATAGDVNGDGFSDILIGAKGYDNGETGEGRAYLYNGSASGLLTTPSWTAEGNQASAYFGWSVTTAGDVNGDGFNDVLVGAPNYSNGDAGEGRAYLYLGSVAGLESTPSWINEGNQNSAQFGDSVASAGDVDGDGYSDIVVGASGYSNGESSEGRAFLYFGNGGSGMPIRPRQAQPPGGLSLIGPLGISDSETEFQIKTRARTPYGRGEVKLQWEVESVGTPFLAPITGESSFWIDTLTTGRDIAQDVTGLVAGTAYHWRARLLYKPGNPFGMVSSRWFSQPFNSVNETDLRTNLVYPAPTLGTILPSSGTQAGGTSLSVTGTGIRPGARLYIGPFLATSVSAAGNGLSATALSGAGAAGLYDVTLVNPDGQSDMLLGAFTYIPDYIDYTTTSGTGDTSDGWGTAWGDVDNDGDEDLYVTNSGTNVLYENDGSGTFIDVTVAAGVGGGSSDSSRGCAFVDFNNDGWLDLYVVNASGTANVLYKNDLDGTFTDVTGSAGVGDASSGMGCAWADIDNDGDVDLFVSNVGADKLYESSVAQASETFTDVTAAAGISDTASGQGCAFADYDLDGDQDLYVCNIGYQNFLYENDGSGGFTEVAASRGVAVWGNSHGVVWGDMDNDGDHDLYVTTSTSNLYFENQAAQFELVGPAPAIWTFLDRSFLSGLDDGWTGRGCSLGDWNNDGHLDLYLVNADFTLPTPFPIPVASSNKMFLNDGDGTFTDVTTEAGVGDTRAGTAGAAADIDADGFLDLYVVNLDHDGNTFDAENVLYRNQGTGGHWLTIKLVGTTSNKSGVGAKVQVISERGNFPFTQTRYVTAGSGFLSEESLPLEFGLGTDTEVEVTVTWPSGTVDYHTVRPVDRIIKITEGSAEFTFQESEITLEQPSVYPLSEDS